MSKNKKTYYLNDKRLSFKAKGILESGFMQLNNFKELLKKSTDGRDSLMAGINELKQYGYCIYLEHRDDDGKFLKGIYHFDKTTDK